jgi:16S rRNA (uracil1498-N3)-methyltransferase
MSHLHRFYHPQGVSGSGSALLSPEESHHALRVLRVRSGDAVELFDGQGHTWTASVGVLSRAEVAVEVTGETFTPREQPGLTLAQAWLHRDKVLDELVRDVTVLGVARICFYRAAHSEKAPRYSPKWTRLAIEACKQCGRRWLPEITVAANLAELLEQNTSACIAVAAMEGPHVPVSSIGTTLPVVYIVGPEGDFSTDEMGVLRERGALPLSLGRYTLRSETAASVGVTLIQQQLGALGGNEA